MEGNGVGRTYKFSIRKKLVVGVSAVAVVTFACSAFILYFLADYLAQAMSIDPRLVIPLTLFVGVIWSAIFGYLLAPFITKPLSELERAVTQAAAGSVNTSVKLSKSDDELRALGIACNDMLASLKQMTSDIEVNFVETDKRVKQLADATERSSSQGEQIGLTMAEIASGAEASAKAIQETAASLEDTTRMATEMKAKADSSKGQAEEMVATLEESRKRTDSLVNGVGELSKKQEASLQSVRRLEQQATEVETIASFVGSIAKQTNLLALNASIEASRAGEHGKGFAVVANEVRNLADECARAVASIGELIAAIQEEMQQTVADIEAQAAVARKQREESERTTAAIAKMEASVKKVAALVGEVSALSDKQQQSIKESSLKTQEVAAIAEETSAGAEEVAAMTEEQSQALEEAAKLSFDLANQAKQLKTTIEKFTIEST
ncbi:methyl-accepting chemotaxis protein [Shouchella clausii]|uniref:methyl-accepting chemotaxis protein n=1 Tax=Shouchella clausii TaxID=79880 RepID=UPI003982D947